MKLDRKLSRRSSRKTRDRKKKSSTKRTRKNLTQRGGGYKYCMIEIESGDNIFQHGTPATFGNCNKNIAQHLTIKQITKLNDVLQFRIDEKTRIEYETSTLVYLFGYIIQLCGYYAYTINKEETDKTPKKIDGITYNILILMLILLKLFANTQIDIRIINAAFKKLGITNIDLETSGEYNDFNKEKNGDTIFKLISSIIKKCLTSIKSVVNSNKDYKLPNGNIFINSSVLYQPKIFDFNTFIYPVNTKINQEITNNQSYIGYKNLIYTAIYNELLRYTYHTNGVINIIITFLNETDLLETDA